MNRSAAGPGHDLTHGPIARHIARLAGFMIVGFVTNNAAQLIEVGYLGVVGTRELAAIAFTFPATFGLHAIGRGLAAGAGSLMARARGAGRPDDVTRIASHCLWLVLVFSLVSVAAGLLWARPFYELLGARGEVLDLAVSYSVIWLLGFPIYVLSTVGGLLLRGIGNATIPGLVMTTGSILQVGFGPILIFGWFGFPALGIDGAAYAFVLARVFAFALALHAVAIREPVLTKRLSGMVESWRAILHIGLPAAANNLIPPVSAAVVTRLVAEHGELVVAGYGVATRIELVFWMILAAVASSVGPIAGQNWGAGRFDRVRETMRVNARFCLAWGALSLVILALFATPIIRLVNAEPVIVDIASSYLLIVAFSIGFVGVQNAASFCFNAIGKPGPGLALSIIRLLVLYVPAAVIANKVWGYTGVFWATAIVNVVAGAIGWAWINSTVARAGE